MGGAEEGKESLSSCWGSNALHDCMHQPRKLRKKNSCSFISIVLLSMSIVPRVVHVLGLSIRLGAMMPEAAHSFVHLALS
jgi:hypothetical protein